MTFLGIFNLSVTFQSCTLIYQRSTPNHKLDPLPMHTELVLLTFLKRYKICQFAIILFKTLFSLVFYLCSCRSKILGKNLVIQLVIRMAFQRKVLKKEIKGKKCQRNSMMPKKCIIMPHTMHPGASTQWPVHYQCLPQCDIWHSHLNYKSFDQIQLNPFSIFLNKIRFFLYFQYLSIKLNKQTLKNNILDLEKM